MKYASVNKIDKHKKVWDEQWSIKQKSSSILEKIASLFRQTLISQLVSYYVNKYFKIGVYVEAGCGTGETSVRLRKWGFTRIGLDISPEALRRAKRQRTYNHYILGDIFNMPFKDESVDGLWNVGVMEHFNQEELSQIFHEFNRVLKSTGCCLFFWPWVLAPSHITLRLYEMAMQKFGRPKQIFPQAPSMFSKRLLPIFNELNKTYRLAQIRFHPPWMDLTHFAIVVIKSENTQLCKSRKN